MRRVMQYESAGIRHEGVENPLAGDTDNAKKVSYRSGIETLMQTMKAHNGVVHVQVARHVVVWNMAAGSAELKPETMRHDGMYRVLHIMERRRPWSQDPGSRHAVEDGPGSSGA